MPSNHLILCRPLLLLPTILPSIRASSNETNFHMRWPKYWSFSFSISPSKEHPGLISFRMDWLDLLAVQGTLKSLLQPHSSKASILQCSAFFTVQLSHPYTTTGKTIALTRRTLPTIGRLKYIKQLLTSIKEKNDGHTVIGDFNAPLTLMGISGQKINMATKVLNDTLEHLYLVDNFRNYIQKSQYTLFSSMQETFSRTDHQLGHKMNLNKFKSIEIISSTSSDHKGIKLELNYRKKEMRKKNELHGD